MDLRQMRYFLYVAEQGSFHAASAVLNVAQSALSRQIQQLEYDIGATLFHRSTKGVSLSPAGEVLRNEVREILARTEEARNRTWRASKGQFGRVVIAYTTRVGEMSWAVAAFADARKSMPDVDFQLRFVSPEKQEAMIASGEIDVGLMYRPPTELRGLQHRELQIGKAKLLVPEDDPLTKKAKVKLTDLVDYDFSMISQSVAPHMYNEMMARCARGGLIPRITVHVQDEAVAVRMVQSGLAISFCDSSVTQRRPIEGLKLIDVADFDLDITTIVIWKSNREDAAISNFIGHLEQRIAQSGVS